MLFWFFLYCLIFGLLWIEIFIKNICKIVRGVCFIVIVSKGVLIGGIMRFNGKFGLGLIYRIVGMRCWLWGWLVYWRIYDLIDIFWKVFYVIVFIKWSWWVLVYFGYLLGISWRFGYIFRIKMVIWKIWYFGFVRIEIIDFWKVRWI